MLTSGRSRHVVAPPISIAVVIYAKGLPYSARKSSTFPSLMDGVHLIKIGVKTFFMRNKGSFYRIWNDDGKMVHVTEDFLNSRRCGTLPRVESVTVSKEVENVCVSLRTLL